MENTMAKIFQNSEFGVIEIITIDGKEYFPATDCAKMLGYSNPHDAVNRHCKTPGCVFYEVGVQTDIKSDGSPAIQNVQKLYINEGNLYRLITHSKLPSAERFERWVFDEVIPEIRMSGGYSLSRSSSNTELAKLISLTVTETVAQIMKQIIPIVTQNHGTLSDCDEKVPTEVKNRRQQKTTIELLSPEIRKSVDNMLIDDKPYVQIQRFLLDCGIELSQASICRYAKKFYRG